MEPLNKNERTTSFLQFLVLLLLTNVFLVVGIFFDVQFFRKDYKELKEKNKQLQRISDLRDRVAALHHKLIEMDNMDVVQYDRAKDFVEEQISGMYQLSGEGDELYLLSSWLDSSFTNAMYDKRKFIMSRDSDSEKKNLEAQIKEKEAEIKEIQNELKQCNKELLNLQRISG
jgi:hypothetical protein